MEVAKIQFSPAEIELVNNVDFILTKNEVLHKIKVLLIQVQELQLKYVEINGWKSHPLFRIPPKISRGENYKGFPYMILDYPRVSNADDFFFIRIFFWWGHFFSSTIHVKGKSKDLIFSNVLNQIEQLQKAGYFISINPDPWIHDFEETNYQLIETFNKQEWEMNWQANDYIKIAVKSPLSDWQVLEISLFNNWKYLLGLSGLVA
jgi:hypothetical protein